MNFSSLREMAKTASTKGLTHLVKAGKEFAKKGVEILKE